MKAILPVAGIGSRLRPHTHTQPKSLIPLAGKPILGHIVDRLVKYGFKEFVFVIGYMGDKIEGYITENYSDYKTDFVIQTAGKGIGHALWLAKEHIENEDEIFIVLGDTIFDTDFELVKNIETSALGIKKVDDPRAFGVAEIGDDGYIKRVVEKPAIPKSNMALVGLYKIKETKELVDALGYIIDNNIKTINEFHLTDALMHMINNGVKFKGFDVSTWFDCGKKDIILETNATLLERLPNNSPDANKYENTIIVPPVYIGENCKISNCIIGPNVSIGENVIMDYSIIKESIIGPHSHIENAILHDSLIGNDASLQGLTQSLNLGDSTEINFG